ncbi:MAG: hypothetical protein M1480_11105 [Bacteroidetes bacterium]|nr:hypothetical protein [Bacteroidota bacterium]
MDSGVTPNDNVSYYVGCALDEVAPDVRIIVTDLKTGTKVVDVLDYNVRYSNHYFDALNDRSYSVYIGSGSTVGWALCEPAN